MADWKKVLVSGSEVSVASITSSVIPSGTGTDEVIVLGPNGEFRKKTQTSIQGTTVANFAISGSTGNDTFSATGDTLIFTGSNGASTTVTNNGTNTNVQVNLPQNTISGSQQITITDTIGYAAFSASLSHSIQNNTAQGTTNATNITTLTNLIDDLVITSSNLTSVSGTIATFITTANTDLNSIESDITALNTFSSSAVTNADTGSFIISESVEGTTNEIEVTPNGSQGLTIGLPTDVTIGGRLEVGKLVIQGQEVNDTDAAIVSGSTIQGNSTNDTHQFTGSLLVTGAFEINNGSNDIIFDDLSADNDAIVDDIIVRTNSTGKLGLIGTAAKLGISGAFDEVSSSIAADISTLSTSATTANATAISNLNIVSSSLVASASQGIRFAAGAAGVSVALNETASFIATGDGLSVSVGSGDVGGTTSVEYTINPTTLGGAIGAFSSSAQLQTILDDIYVNYSETPISGAEQLQTLGFITASDFDTLVNVPNGLISGAEAGVTQGTIKINDVEKAVAGLGTGDSPTFNSVVLTGDLTVKGDTTALETDELNVEDQFLLINSGAGGGNFNADKDGGVIVDTGNGSGALLMYKREFQAWGFKGTTNPDSAGVDFNDESISSDEVNPDVLVATVKQTALGNGNAPGDATANTYGVDGTIYQKGQMHINTDDSTIWIYV